MTRRSPRPPGLRTPILRTLGVSGALAAALGALLSCGGATRGNDLQVLSFAPQGPIERDQPITIRFDKPVVPEQLVGKPADPSTVHVSPAFAWTGHWQDQRTLVIDPKDKLAPSTRYEVSLAGELGKRAAGFRLAFVHRPLVVEGLWGEVDGDMLAPEGAIPLAFNQPVRPAEAAARCKLTGEQDELALTVSPGAAAGEPAAQITLRTARPLTQGAAYSLYCAELTGAGGNAPIAPYSLALQARPALTVTAISPEGGDVAADEVALEFTFSTPVTLDAARKAISSTPAIPGLANGYLNDEGTEYRVTADLDAETRYTVKVAGLTDTFGQQLARPREASFKTGDARPRLAMERGIFALEASAKGYPLWSRNVGAYDVACAAIPKDRVVQTLTTEMNYDPWGGDDADAPIDWKKLRLGAKRSSHKTTGKNKWSLDELDLGKLCGATSGARGVYLAEISSDEVEPDPQRGWISPRRNRVLANVTDLGVLLKVGTSSGIVWVTSLVSGAPVGAAKVTVYDPKGKQVWTGATDADGLARVPGSSVLRKQKPTSDPGEEDFSEWDSYRSQRLIAVIEKAGDTAVIDGNWSNGIQTWNFGVAEDRRGGATKVRGFIQSDRGLYRPGERVHFKGIARELAQGRPPRVPERRGVAIEVQDSRGQTVLQTKTTLSAFGGFAFDLALGAEASLGDYYVRAEVADQVFREKFSVEEFRSATFELGLRSATKAPRPGEQLAFELEAKYLFGAPAAVIHDAVEKSMKDGKHDPAAIGKALGLPAANFEGPLRMMTLDIDDVATCVRLPVDEDPGVWKCQTPEDQDCFKFGGYTSGGVPEIMVINAPVEKTAIQEVQ